MRLRIVTFGLDGVGHQDYLHHCETVAPAFATWDGLVEKRWLADTASGTYGGVYVFNDVAAADRSRNTAAFAAMLDNEHFVDLEIVELDTVDALDAITGRDRGDT